LPNRYVALLDVLGFASIVSGDRQGERLTQYLNALQAAVVQDPAVSPLEYVVFSDSIVLTTVDESEASFRDLVVACARSFNLLLKQEMALRGAIALGSVLVEKTPGGTFVAGSAVVEAYTYEKSQDWVGIMLAPSAVRANPDLAERCNIGEASRPEDRVALLARLPWPACLHVCHRIPFHSSNAFESSSFDGFAILPTNRTGDPEGIRDDLTWSLAQLLWLKALAPDPRAQQKYRESHEWIGYARQEWKDAANWFARAREQSA
jgi:hypothetical protein